MSQTPMPCSIVSGLPTVIEMPLNTKLKGTIHVSDQGLLVKCGEVAVGTLPNANAQIKYDAKKGNFSAKMAPGSYTGTCGPSYAGNHKVDLVCKKK